MTLRDVARYLRINEKQVGRLAQDGELPAQKLPRGWRFSRTAIDAWKTSHPSTETPGEVLHAAAVVRKSEPLTIAGAMDTARMNLHLHGVTKDAVLRELVALALDPNEKRQAELFFQALKAREDMCSTCVNDGIAIPHARNALIGLVSKPLLAYARHPEGIDFGAMDGKPVQHFFLLCAPNVREHLRLLARLSRILHNPEFRIQLAAAKTPDEIIALVSAAEQSIPAS